MSTYPLSVHVEAGPLVFFSGQLGVADGRLVDGGFAAEAPVALANLAATVEAAGLSLRDVVKVNIFLTSMADYADFNGLYTQTFSEPFPARTAVCVGALPAGGSVEVECVALRPSS